MARRRFVVVRGATSLLVGLTLAAVAVTPARAADDDRAFFESRVRPLLIKHCQSCHGSKKQESGLRLDSRDAWKRGGDRGQAVVVGKPNDSLLVQAVRYTDDTLKMPPKGKLTAREVAVLVEWVRRGAPDPRRVDPSTNMVRRMSLAEAREFWSFQPIEIPEVPTVDDPAWARRPVDAFIQARLREQGIQPVGLSDRRTLIRRATIDLTGLPPTREQIRKFLEDESPDAFAALVDRLLSSSAYGERWGRHWLDVARYADTAGDGADYPVREAYKYRDWVIRAFNQDMPFDQFVREQIAGDILATRELDEHPDRYADRVTATGFLAVGKRYGYKAAPDYQYLDFADVIDSVGRSLLGLSLGCARCHDHKYDPVSARDYYALYGIFQSTRWAFPGGEEQKRPAHFPPLVPPGRVQELEQAKARDLAALDATLSNLKQKQAELDPNWIAGGFDLGFEAQASGKPPGKPWVCSGPIEITREAQSPFVHVHPPGKLGVRIGSGKPTDGLRYVFRNGLKATPGRLMHFTVDFRSVADSKQTGAYRFYLGRGVVQSLAVECSATSTAFAIRNGKTWETIRTLSPGTWYTLRITIDPAARTYRGLVGTRDDLVRFENKSVGPGWDGVADCFICDAFGHVAGPACSRDLDNIGFQDVPFSDPDGKPVAPRSADRDAKQQAEVISARIKDVETRRKSRAMRPAYEVAYGVSEADPVSARVQLRGEPDRLGAEVPRRFLEVLGADPLPQLATGSGRMELAGWITRSSNPLTARVIVNRIWGWHFGRGLVSTPSDFGARGERPSHPRLLDWLAGRFMASGWSIKGLHRQIMLSRTYQLASDDDAKNLRLDPQNTWHWRFARRPMDAESIRDSLLALGGHLDRKVPGQHPFPPVNSWGFTIHNPFHAVYDSDHRSVYLMVQRNRRHPYLALFDAADPNQSVATRQPTTTPTQALFLMNSPFVHRQAGGLAARLLTGSSDPRKRILAAFEMAHGRVPDEPTIASALQFVRSYEQKLPGDTGEREKEQASWAALARVILTSNAFLYVD